MPEYRVTPAVVHQVVDGELRVRLEWLAPSGRRYWLDITEQLNITEQVEAF
jgi:hypothetical protein